MLTALSQPSWILRLSVLPTQTAIHIIKVYSDNCEFMLAQLQQNNATNFEFKKCVPS